ncbi:type VII secretion target [Nocardioides sp. CPCC 205120]|uniref:type VII secretion target n=1 Tax=Nocardioides sp. CPCC 205120 TaxID=3406462 RepID=UPI003B513F5D
MLDPDTLHQRVTSGEPAPLRAHAETLRSEAARLDAAREQVVAAAAVPTWTGLAASVFAARIDGLLGGVDTTRNLLTHAAGGFDEAAASAEDAIARGDAAIVPWRERDPALPEFVQQLLAAVVSTQLTGIASDHDARLAAVTAVMTGDGDELDLDALDEETREWVERGLERTEDWLADNGSSLGPLIPNTAATGDERGWIPQGLGYSDATGLLLQSYYTKDGDSTLALIDEAGGAEVNEVQLGDEEGAAPGHVGGVTVDGDHVYVSSGSRVYTYSLEELRNAPPGTRVDASTSSSVPAASYTAVADGKLYVGSHADGVMYVYVSDGDGGWVPELDGSGEPVSIDTPADVQGVVVRDGEFVFSTSHGRQNESALVVQDRESGERSDPYVLPNMSQGIVEIDGEIVTTYESGAEEFDDAGTGRGGWFWGVPDADGLWANPHMTRTPLDELGLDADEVEVEPATLQTAGAELAAAAELLRSVAGAIDGVRSTAAQLGDVPSAGPASTALNELVDLGTTSLQAGARAVDGVVDGLAATASDYAGTDDGVAGTFGGMLPW